VYNPVNPNAFEVEILSMLAPFGDTVFCIVGGLLSIGAAAS
jgi:hypothetical protein